jgi:membrane protein required for colicin V production
MEPHSGLNNLDLIVIGFILLFGGVGLTYGFVRSVLSPFSPVTWIASCWAALRFYPLAVPLVHHYVKQDKFAEWAAMGCVGLLTVIIVTIIGGVFAHFAIRGRALTSIDRSLGFVYGVAQGFLIVSCLYLAATVTFWPDIDKPAVEEKTDKPQQDKDRNAPPDLLMQAKTRPVMSWGASKVAILIPQDLVDKGLKKLDEHQDQAERAAAQKTLDKLSTPTPPQPAEGAATIDINRIQGSQP